MKGERKENVHIILSDHELQMLTELAEAVGLNRSNYLRQLIRSEHARRTRRPDE